MELFFLCQDEPPGSTVITILATDKDHGKNAEISYSLLQEGDYEYFEMDPVTGILRNRRILDRETKPRYQVIIEFYFFLYASCVV